ncbi:MAG: methylenetetrahydrofolate--tRNA-(uracil(54)-C(5))-methyltransferase (FADH(2)-oxidizing) TrmFO [Clostridia bacterium]|nr:methylenetetrahydrofolate--tRNA-(uracil(54)-C(5))-methyltransferase (FADH(2)-oxidizing) TrmFO [Clostridia bacterium]
MEKTINVIGAGLAGCEAAWQIAQKGINVNLYDMKPGKFSPAHKSENLCELVCSNSFKASRIDSAAGLLKEEMRNLKSLVVACADECSIPAGGALAVDREKFSFMVTEKIKNNKLINYIPKEITRVPEDGINIIATGPLTSEALAEDIAEICGGKLSFFDAAAPIVTFESVDMEKAFFASRYGKGSGDDYLNCPLDEEEYKTFYNELINAERAPLHGVDVENPKVYEGCMPVEIMAKRGYDTLRFGPMKPVGLTDPKTGKRPYAAVQLRKENAEGSLYNMVGFQTNLKFPEQKRVFGLIPALKNADIVRYGVMHRNMFIDSPRLLNRDYSLKTNENLFFAGQITGVEGYMESVSSGLLCGINAVKRLNGEKPLILSSATIMGALAKYISDSSVKDFQPMGANFGIISPLLEVIKDKKMRYNEFASRSIKYIKNLN